jgi:hypothetical protein
MDYQDKIKEVYQLSQFSIDNAIYKYYLVGNYTEPQRHLMIVNNGNEITVVTKEENAHLLTVLNVNKENWRLINIKCGKPFYCVGFLAGISEAFAKNGIDITITSTFEYDFIFVQEKFLEEAILIMISLGIIKK